MGPDPHSGLETHAVDLVSCPSCGRLENRSHVECSHCGTRLPTLEPAPVLDPMRTIGKKIIVGAIGFTVGPAIVLLIRYWIGFLFLGLFTTLVGYVLGIMYIIYGGRFRDLSSHVRTTQNISSPGGWLNRFGGGPLTVPGVDAQTVKAEDLERRDEND